VAPEQSGFKSRASSFCLLALGLCTIAGLVVWGRQSSSLATPKLLSEDGSSPPNSSSDARPLLSSSFSFSSSSSIRTPARPKESKALLDPATSALLHDLLDPNQPLSERREKARALAKLGSEQAMAALRAALQDGPPYLKAAVGEGLGESPHPNATALMIEMIQGSDETAARGAVRGLALRGDAESTESLRKVLFDEHATESVRTEAALALGDVHNPAALAALTDAATQWQEGNLTDSILEGLGKRPFAETEDFFRSYLELPGISSESKVAAIEALANAPDDASSMLLKLAADSGPEVRAAAAWSLVGNESEKDISAPLLALLQQEQVPDVRTRLYQALANHEGWDPSAVLGLAQNETDPEARLAALELLASASGSATLPGSDAASLSAVVNYFNGTAVPELKNTALNSGSQQERLSSVSALALARTPDATAALTEISGASKDPRVLEAANAALSRAQKPVASQ
jgi:HEAT repeat protein